MAGIVGVDPLPLTLRELVWMAEARRRDQWSHTATLLAMTANVNRNPKKRATPYSPLDFHPLVERRTDKPKVGVGVLKTVFVRHKKSD